MKIKIINVTIIIIISVVIGILKINSSNKNELPKESNIKSNTEFEIQTEIFTVEEILHQIEKTSENVTEEATEQSTEQPKIVSLGTFKITAYCSCEKCCGQWALNRPNNVVYGASGAELIADYSVAVDTDLIPYGEKIIINNREYIAHDCGGAIQGNRIDIYMSSHEKALQWGVQNLEVFKVVGK